uniref:ORF61 n=1 Tax=Malaco herpesvirus 2 TaxID=3031798 RepID=A0AA48SFE4_9VIRU|nr:TPA_asm: ORF61 [Malaco herpesvirus 2]
MLYQLYCLMCLVDPVQMYLDGDYYNSCSLVQEHFRTIGRLLRYLSMFHFRLHARHRYLVHLEVVPYTNGLSVHEDSKNHHKQICQYPEATAQSIFDCLKCRPSFHKLICNNIPK